MKFENIYTPSDFTVLIVEDTLINVKTLSAVLTKEGFKVLTAETGEECIKIANSQKIDLILLDVLLPGKSGFDVAVHLQKQGFTNLPIIFLSALTEVESKVKGFKSGGVDFITKPFQREEVLARIQAHLKIKKLEEERVERIKTLRNREVELSLINKKKEDLVRMVSHDIRNPITGIIGLLNIMKEDNPDKEEREEMIDIMLKSSNDLMDLLKNELDNYSTNSIKDELDLKLWDINNTVKNAIELNNSKAKMKKISLSFHTNNTKINLKHDIHKIEIVINNLISNALKFTLPNGEVNVETEEKQDSVLIKIADTGIGIPEEMLERFLIPQEHVLRNGTAGEIGSGLGLEITLDFINLHKGKIWVESEEYLGTTFFIDLPKKISKNKE